MKVSFGCVLCRDEGPADPPRLPSWARVGAFASLSWPALDTPSDGDEWPVRVEAPAIGARVLAHVTHLFEASVGERFWAWFAPRGATGRGFAFDAEDLAGAAALACRLEAIEELTADFAWLRLAVEDAVAVRAICDRFDEDRSGRLPSFLDQRKVRVDWNDLAFFEGSAEGEIGRWVLCHAVGDEQVLVAEGDWHLHGSYVYVGHRPLDAREWRALEKRFGPRGG